MSDLIDRQAAISEIMEDLEDRSLHDDPATPEDYAEGYDEGIRNAAAIVLQVLSAQPSVSKTEIVEDTISRAAVVDAIEDVDWYHQNENGEMVHGANSAEDQPWYKAEDIYAAIEGVPSAQLVAKDINVPVKDCISRQAAIAVADSADYTGLAVEDVKKVTDEVVKGLKQLPSAQSELENKIRAIGYTGKEGRIYIGGRLFAVRELPQ